MIFGVAEAYRGPCSGLSVPSLIAQLEFNVPLSVQAVLEAGSIAARLHLIIEVLQERKDQLSALYALEQGYSKEGQQEDPQ